MFLKSTFKYYSTFIEVISPIDLGKSNYTFVYPLVSLRERERDSIIVLQVKYDADVISPIDLGKSSYYTFVYPLVSLRERERERESLLPSWRSNMT